VSGAGLSVTAAHGRLPRTESFRVRLSIVNTFKDALLWVQERVGGSVKIKTRVKGCKPVWIWEASRTDAAQEILRRRLPYLKIKQEQAQIALLFPAYVRTNRWGEH
jgi:hypothetical protein